MKILNKEVFQKHFKHQFSLRLHMLAILLATTLSGALFCKVLLICSVADFRWRYPLSVLASYLVFFCCIKLWLYCISPSRSKKTNVLSGLDLPSSSGRGSGGGGAPLFRGGGGRFSGAGASGSLEGNNAAVVQTGILAQSQPAPVSSSPGGVGHVVGDGLGSLGDDDTIVAVIVLAILVATIFFSAIYILYYAPAILSEAAFQGFLAASLIRRTRAMSDHSWLGSVFRMTWKPFAVTFAVAFLSGVILHSYFPGAARLADILWKG